LRASAKKERLFSGKNNTLSRPKLQGKVFIGDPGSAKKGKKLVNRAPITTPRKKPLGPEYLSRWGGEVGGKCRGEATQGGERRMGNKEKLKKPKAGRKSQAGRTKLLHKAKVSVTGRTFTEGGNKVEKKGSLLEGRRGGENRRVEDFHVGNGDSFHASSKTGGKGKSVRKGRGGNKKRVR